MNERRFTPTTTWSTVSMPRAALIARAAAAAARALGQSAPSPRRAA